MTLTLGLIVLTVSLVVSFLCSVLEAVLLSISHSYVALLQDEGRSSGNRLHKLRSKIDEPISAILTLNTIAHTAGAATGGALALQEFGSEWVAMASAVLTLVILLFSEILPKTMGATYWKELAPVSGYILTVLVWIMKPVLIPLSLFSRLLTRQKVHGATVSRSELEILAEIGRREGTLDEDEWRVVTNVMNLDQITVGEVMTPRTDVVAVHVGATVEEAKALMLDEGHLRLPVFDESLDHIVGILLARDLWRADREGVTSIRGILRPTSYTPDSSLVVDLIPEMRSGSRTNMVIVVDEFGGTAGLATLEDLIEEIVGEIQDEHEVDEPTSFQETGDGSTKVWGGASIREVNERFGFELDEESFDTIGGWVFGSLNRLPSVGDAIEMPSGVLSVSRMQGRRVEYLRFDPRASSEPMTN